LGRRSKLDLGLWGRRRRNHQRAFADDRGEVRSIVP
jgi:hypothetical protein